VSISSDSNAPTAADAAGPNRYRVDVRQDAEGWGVAIVDPDGRDAPFRACADETEAWTYASTVRQHAYWLSEAAFREYYRLPEGTEA
jgi:hypothetical protein